MLAIRAAATSILTLKFCYYSALICRSLNSGAKLIAQWVGHLMQIVLSCHLLAMQSAVFCCLPFALCICPSLSSPPALCTTNLTQMESADLKLAKYATTAMQLAQKRKENFTFFSGHNGSLLRQQPVAGAQSLSVALLLVQCRVFSLSTCSPNVLPAVAPAWNIFMV